MLSNENNVKLMRSQRNEKIIRSTVLYTNKLKRLKILLIETI
jgi:hypothetical protein